MSKKLNSKMIVAFLKSIDNPNEFEIVTGGDEIMPGVYIGTPNPHKRADGAPVFQYFYEIDITCKVTLKSNQLAILHHNSRTLYIYDQYQNWWVLVEGVTK